MIPEATATTRRSLIAAWLAAAIVLGALMAVARASESGLDDADPAQQRPGFLDAGALPQPAPRLTAALPVAGRRTVVFFVHPKGLDEVCRALSGPNLAERADVAVVVSGPGRCDGVATVNDPAARLGRSYGLHRPRAGGPPVGYAVIDRRGLIRYRTLDPTVADHLGEVDTIVRAVP
ncbi:MAG: hypothetical protein ACR2MO_04590 [Acidimicrobiales bacterium]